MQQDNTPLTPAEPPVTVSAADQMAQVQRPLGFDTLGFLHKAKPSLSSPSDLIPRFKDDSHIALSQLLQPMQSTPNNAANTSRPYQPPFNPLAINNLLTAEDTSQRPSAGQQRTYAEEATQRLPTSVVSPLNGAPSRDTSRSRVISVATRFNPARHAYASDIHSSQTQQTPVLPLLDRETCVNSPRDRDNSPTSATHSQTPSHRSFTSNYSPLASSHLHYPAALPNQIVQPLPFTYTLSIRQQPVAARACGFGERDRRVVDPPPVLELKITEKSTSAPTQDPGGLLALSCELTSVEDGDRKDSGTTRPTSDLPPSRRLMGTTVASPYQAKDERGVAGTFFVFSDLSCRSPGTYKLKYSLVRVDPTMMVIGTRHPTVVTIETNVFTVYAAKDFPGMQASSALLKALRDQGLNVGLKKGVEARVQKKRAARGGSDSSEDEEQVESASDSDETAASEDSAERLRSKTKGKSRKQKKKRRKLEA